MDILALYRTLISQIDAIIGHISQIHADSIQCRAGCSECCVNFTVGAGEFTAIKKSLHSALPEHISGNKDKGECFFLKDNLCSIYEIRPIICRTHGFPVRYKNERDETAYASCDKNGQTDMNESNTLNIDEINEKLAILNKLAIKENPNLKERYFLHEIFS